MSRLAKLMLLAVLLQALPATAVIETYEFSDPLLEERYQLLSAELRCPKCQNQNIADSNAPISQDLRKLLHQQLEKGASDDEILDYMVARYGEFVRYRPRFSGATIALWLAPGLLVLGGVLITFVTLRGRRQPQAANSTALSPQENQRVQDLLAKSERDS